MSQFTTSDGLTLYYETHGAGDPVVLLHSFGFDGSLWTNTGVVDALVAQDRLVIVPDARGHGRSDHPADPTRYSRTRRALDVTELLDEMGIEITDLASYSMGSGVALRVLQTEPRIRRAVLGGIGGRVLVPRSQADVPDPRQLSAEEAAQIILTSSPYLQTRIDRGDAHPLALIAILQAGFGLEDADFSTVAAEVLFLSGTDDDDPSPLRALFPHASTHLIAGDHGTTMDNPEFARSLASFLVGGTAT
jgi:pimeloyl-ACP methyl ester carboxylesterase